MVFFAVTLLFWKRGSKKTGCFPKCESFFKQVSYSKTSIEVVSKLFLFFTTIYSIINKLFAPVAKTANLNYSQVTKFVKFKMQGWVYCDFSFLFYLYLLSNKQTLWNIYILKDPKHKTWFQTVALLKEKQKNIKILEIIRCFLLCWPNFDLSAGQNYFNGDKWQIEK